MKLGNKHSKLLVYFLLITLFTSNSSLAIDKTDKDVKLEEQSKINKNSMFFYPRLSINNDNIFFSGAETLEEGDLLINMPFSFSYFYSPYQIKSKLNSNLSFGLFSDLTTFNLQYPLEYNNKDGFIYNSNLYSSFLIRLIKDPFTLSIQPKAKISMDTTKSFSYLGGDILANKIFGDFYLQGLTGYNYSLNGTNVDNHNFNYILSLGWSPETIINKIPKNQYIFAFTAYGDIPVNFLRSKDFNYNYLSSRLDFNYKISDFEIYPLENWDLNAYVEQSIINNKSSLYTIGGFSLNYKKQFENLNLKNFLELFNWFKENENKTEKTEFQEKVEEKSKKNTSMNFYPRLALNNDNIFFSGAETLEAGDFVFNAPISSYYNYDTNISVTTPVNFSLGLFSDNLTLNGQYPLKLENGVFNYSTDIYASFLIKLLSKPFTLSIQPKAKISIFPSTANDGYQTVGLDILFNKDFENFYIQGLAGYKYKINNYNTQVFDYVLSTGWTPDNELKNFSTALSFYGNKNIFTSDKNNTKENFLSSRVDFLWRFPDFNLLFIDNLDLDLYLEQSIITSGINPYSGLGASLTYKIDFGELLKRIAPNFDQPKLLKALSMANLPKTDAEQIKAKNIINADRGRDLYINTCSRCHALISINKFNKKEWEEKIHNYRIKKVINKAEESAIMDFISKYKKVSSEQ
ncbi:MAG: hypothetical protein U0457_07075 [Candidatus Sericytochromatia bacterium]